jgi:hypothetical protein
MKFDPTEFQQIWRRETESLWTMTVAQLVNTYPALYTTSEFISVFTATVTGAYPNEINPIRIPTTHILKADHNVALPLGISGCLQHTFCKQ